MKKQLYFVILTIIFLNGTLKIFAQDTIPLTITPPMQTGLCHYNLFATTFVAQGQHFFTIQAELLRDTTVDTVFFCSEPVIKPKLLIVFDSSTTTLLSQSTDTSAGKWTGQINASDTVTIWYHVYLDCSSINRPNTSTVNLNLRQTFTDSLNFFYNTGSGTNTHLTGNIPGLRIISPNNPIFSSSYLNPTYLTFYYINSGQGNAQISFSFTPDTTNYCGMLTYDSLQFSIGTNGPFQPLSAMTLTSTPISGSDTLVIRHRALVDTCITSCNSAKVFFQWQCAQPPSMDSIFCNNCTQPIQTNFTLSNNNNALVKIERVTPTFAEANYDNTCFNDTTDMAGWHFRITNNGVGALDSVWVNLSSNDSIEFLSLIPTGSFSMQTTCTACIDSVLTLPRTNYLCQDFVPNALNSAWFRLINFRETDTIDVYFQTFRCASEDSLLFSVPKTMNNWRLQVLGKGVCLDTALNVLVGNPFFGFTHQGTISGHADNGASDLSLNYQFTPTVTDLTVPDSVTFGQTETLEIYFNGGINGEDRQVLGCLSDTCSQISGYLKAVVKCEQGLVIRHPDSQVKIKMFNDSINGFMNLNPVYHHTLTPIDECVRGEYSYYFDLSNPVFKNVLDSGIFEFTLQACCEPVLPTTYSISFSLLANPDSCLSLSFPPGDTLSPVCTGLGCAWIPLKRIPDNEINIHCPGCVTPGMIVSNYILRRTSFGLQDSDNDGLADSTATLVEPGTTWFNSYPIKTYHSTVGDELEDLLVAHFQEGDPGNLGYDYNQLLSLGARLNYLQLMREIPKGLDTMKLTPKEFTFYIDSADAINYNCIDCDFFSVDTLKYRTMLKLKVDASHPRFTDYLELFPSVNRMLFSFESLFDSVNLHTGNLHDADTLIVYADTANPFKGFFENQKYRLHVTYHQCATHITSQASLTSQEDIAARSAIKNSMWLSGSKQNHDAYPNLLAPQNLTDLNSAHWTLDTNNQDTTLVLIDNTFSNQYVFYCSGYGKFHYFFYQNIGFTATAFNDSSCFKKIRFESGIRTRANTIKAFPFEYRPTPLWHNQIDVTIPFGYTISSAKVRSGLNFGSFGLHTPWQPFIPPGTMGVLTLKDSSWMQPVTFYEHQYPLAPGDSSLYVLSEATNIIYEFTLSPDSCIKQPLVYADSSIVFNFGLTPIPFVPLDSTFCQPDSTIVKASDDFWSQKLVTLPNLDGYFNLDTLEALNQQVCFNLTLTNASIPLDSPATVHSTGAAHVFLVLPDPNSYPFLYNWTFISGTDTIIPSGNIIPLDTWLPSGSTINGNLCAYYNPCQDTIVLPFYVGWNCDSFPSWPWHPDSVCGSIPLSVVLKDVDVSVTSGGKDHPSEYNLCQPFEISTPFTSELFGGYVPQSISLDNLPPGLTPLYAFINTCNGLQIDTLQLLSPWTWNITSGNLMAVGVSDSALNENECLKVTISLMPGCEFAGTDSLPAMILDGHTFCGDTMSVHAHFTGTFVQDSSLCTDCFSIEKSALQDTVFVGDTATFQILICGNNSAAQQVLLTEVLPQNFTLISTVPSFINVPAQGCDTLLVNGYYSTPGTCNDSTYINTAQIITSVYDTIYDTACITVLDSCIAFSNVIIPDSAFATTYGSGFSNTTVYISGVFFIDSTFTLSNCTAYTSSSAQIIVLAGGNLILDSASVIMGCSSMWPGITLDTTAKIVMMNQSQLQDAHYGIFAGFNSTVDVENSKIYDCVTGIYTPPAAGFVNTQVKVRGSKIGLNAQGFKADYPGQPAHGVIPKAGIEINNIVMTLGGTGQRNEFFKMNTGIVANNSNLLVKNTEFYNIGYDTIYTEPYRGTAMVGVVEEGFTGKLTVVAEPTAYYAVHDCHRAIYTDRTVLSANYVHLIDVYSGIYGTNTPDLQSSHVTGCTITTQTYGIFWINNRSAKFMIANNNNITVNGASNSAAKGFSKTAIYMSETMQQPVVFMATGNEITLNNAHNGIYSGNQSNAKIKFNNIRMNSSSVGIGINNNNRSSISCNSITGDYLGTASYQSIGILTGNSSDRTGLHCNTTDSTYRGFYFGGANPNTVMKGNNMKHHFNGLYLNNIAVIGLQPHHGNRWVGPFNSFAGVNIASQILVQASRFDVDSTLGPVYNPVVSPASGWFQQDTLGSGNTFYCSNSTVCELPPPSLSQTEINELIAAGTLLSEEYAEETRAIAEEYLYRELMEDSALRYSDSLYIEFMLENQGEPVAYLYDAEEYLRAATEFDSVFTALIDSANVQIDAINDTLQMIDEGIEFYGSSYDYGALREQLLHAVDFLNQTIANLYSQAEAGRNGNLAEAEIRNDLAVPETVPEENAYILNDTEIEFLESAGNRNVVLSRYTQLLAIAHQCPYTGGPAVERARAFIAMISDSMEYDDDAVCLQVGVYRGENELAPSDIILSNKTVEIIPNPANSMFAITLKSKYVGICNVSVRNSKEQLIFADNFQCDSKSFNVFSGSWKPGVYFVSVTIDNSFTEIQKLVIVK